MAKNNQVRMPSSGAGITSFSEGTDSKFPLQPVTVLIIIAFFVLIVVGLHMLGGSLL